MRAIFVDQIKIFLKLTKKNWIKFFWKDVYLYNKTEFRSNDLLHVFPESRRWNWRYLWMYGLYPISSFKIFLTSQSILPSNLPNLPDGRAQGVIDHVLALAGLHHWINAGILLEILKHTCWCLESLVLAWISLLVYLTPNRVTTTPLLVITYDISKIYFLHAAKSWFQFSLRISLAPCIWNN